jgi:uncharacterized protein (DUF2336 family)
MNRTNGSSDYERARGVLESGDNDGIRLLAADAGCRPEMLYYLTGAEDPAIRALVAANPATPFQADDILVDDRTPAVRGSLARKLVHRLDGLDPDAAARATERARRVLRRLAEDQAVEVRRMVAEEVRASAAIPRDIALILARDIDEGVCCPVLEFSPLLDDEDLVALVDDRLSSPALTAIARRAGLGEAVSDRIAGTLDEAAVAALLTNASAQIREATLDMIIDAAPGAADWHRPLVNRAGLSGSAIRRIATFVADELLEVIARRADLTDRMTEDLRSKVATRIARHSLESDDNRALLDAIERELAARHADGRLTPGFIAEAAEIENHAEVWVALGLLTGAGRAFAHRVFASRNAKAITALAWLADLPAWIIVTLQTRIGGIPDKECLRPRGVSEYPLSDKEMLWQLDLFGYREPESKAAV